MEESNGAGVAVSGTAGDEVTPGTGVWGLLNGFALTSEPSPLADGGVSVATPGVFAFETGLVAREATAATAHQIRYTRGATDEAKKLLEEAMKLPVSQRARLLSSLIDSLAESDEADVEQAWIDEVHKRARELETGQVRGLTWAEAHRIILGT